MANKMLIDAAHPEETRVVVLRGNRVEEFDFESANRRQLRGNIYLAKVTRVEPSLQAAFVDYGGNRHGFLAFSEIHPDYYQIPVADRQALIAEEERAHRAAEEEHEDRSSRRGRHRRRSVRRNGDRLQSRPVEDADPTDVPLAAVQADEIATEESDSEAAAAEAFEALPAQDQAGETSEAGPGEDTAHEDEQAHAADDGEDHDPETPAEDVSVAPEAGDYSAPATDEARDTEHDADHEEEEDEDSDTGDEAAPEADVETDDEEEEVVESVGGADALEEVQDRAPRFRRQYKIQEVIKRRQIMLVQVVKEERGTKGAALTTYLSLAGRYSVLMPNTARGGGISRKITNAQDRARLKEAAAQLDVPEGMGVILRTAGASRTPTEIKRDFEYLLRVWETVRDLTLKSTAPTLVYEEGSLVKRSIRDLYNKDIDEVIVAGEAAYREAKDFMRMLMPSHAKNVKFYRDPTPMFSRYGIESQLDAMFSPTVHLRSGGYLVVNQTEALVAIDVNSGRATREHHIEDTALKTNLEAAEEVARQLRLRDLAGLIVIDFIDMDENRNNRAVERRLKDALKNDRARIQVGRISHFGLMEMSRQRIRASVLESSTDKCPHCGGTGHVRSVSSLSLQVLRVIEETLLRGATHNLVVRTGSEVALYILNHKRGHLRDLEERFRISIAVTVDATLGGQQPFVVEKGEQVHSPEQARAIAAETHELEPLPEEPADEAVEAAGEPEEAEPAEAEADTEAEGEAGEEPREGGRRRRRRRRRGRSEGERREAGEATAFADAEQTSDEGQAEEAPEAEGEAGEANGEEPREGHDAEAGGEPFDPTRRRRRRGRRGGRRNRRERDGAREPLAPGEEGFDHASAEEVEEIENAGPVEPEVAEAVADFGGPPAEMTRPDAGPAQPAPAESAQAESETPRSRSTVREPVSLFVNRETTPSESPASPAPVAPEPAPSAAEPEPADGDGGEESAAGRPRRTGWWAKRLLGNKG